MNLNLMGAFYKLVDILKSDLRCLGGWHFGSITRGLDDEYSDVDPVFLIDGNHFKEFDKELPVIFHKICDNVIIYWRETFNNDEIKNYGVDLILEGKVFQFDIFLLNSLKMDSWWCQMHYKDTKINDIIFDRNGEIMSLISDMPRAEIPQRNIIYSIETYWHHINMIIKYFMREDYFKLLKNLEILLQAHIELLLGEYDCIAWGGWDSKIKFIPKEKQEHLKLYFASNNFVQMKQNINTAFEWFSMDGKEICTSKGLEYPIEMEKIIKQEYITRLLMRSGLD